MRERERKRERARARERETERQRERGTERERERERDRETERERQRDTHSVARHSDKEEKRNEGNTSTKKIPRPLSVIKNLSLPLALMVRETSEARDAHRPETDTRYLR